MSEEICSQPDSLLCVLHRYGRTDVFPVPAADEQAV